MEQEQMCVILVRGLVEDSPASKGAGTPERALMAAEVKGILDSAAETLTTGEARRLSVKWRRRLSGSAFSDSVRLIREDRSR